MSSPLSQPVCPECKVGHLYYTKRVVAHQEGWIRRIRTEAWPDLDDEGLITFDENSEEVRCSNNTSCDARWPSWDDFATCYFAVDHAEECVL